MRPTASSCSSERRSRRRSRTAPPSRRAAPRHLATRSGRSGGSAVIKGGAVPTYIMLSVLTPEGVQTIKNNPSRIQEVNREVEQLGATVKAQWATLGHFDFVNVVEAPDEATIAKVSMELGSRGTAKYETLVAIPIDDFISSVSRGRTAEPIAPRLRVRSCAAGSEAQ